VPWGFEQDKIISLLCLKQSPVCTYTEIADVQEYVIDVKSFRCS